MKSLRRAVVMSFSFFLPALVAALVFSVPTAHAGLTLDLQLQRVEFDGNYYFGCSPSLSTNTLAPQIAPGTYRIESPLQPTNGFNTSFLLTTNGAFFGQGGGGSLYGDDNFPEFINNITNGLWSIYVTNTVTTNRYRFRVTSTITSNSMPRVTITFPLEGSTAVTNQPNFQWQGPAAWAGYIYAQSSYWTNGEYDFHVGTSLPGSFTNWPFPSILPPTTNQIFVQYVSNNVPTVVIATPTNGAGQVISGWSNNPSLVSYATSAFRVGTPVVGPGGSGGGHTNVAYYSFEDNNLFAHDYSGQGNHIAVYSNAPHLTNDALHGSYAFFPAGTGWIHPPTNLLDVFASSFSVSLWLKTTDVHGNNNDSVYSAAGIVSAFSGPGQNLVMPMGLTGSKLAFYTGGDDDDTLHSLASINTGSYVHVVVTRNRQSGEKKIYINGALDNSSLGSTDLLDDGDAINVGYNNGATFNGEMDEVQFYSGILSGSEVTQLYNNPGTTIPNSAGGPANGLVAHYDFNGGTPLAADVSGNGNNLTIAGDFGGNGPSTNSDHIASLGGSLSFDGGSFISAPTNLLSTLAASFTISLWVKTSQDNGNPNDYAWSGDAIISADSPNFGEDDLIPVALTGGQVAFNTANTEFNYDDTINSSTYVSDGDWHHVVVSRNQPTGEKFIYIDGVLDVSDVDSTNLLNDPKILTLGCKTDASDPDQTSPSFSGSNGYDGLVDDIQIYSRALSSNEVAYLYNNPGATLGTTTTNTQYPVDVDLQFSIQRVWENGSEYFDASVSFNSVSPEASTTNRVRSPNGFYNTATYPGGGSGGAVHSSSLSEVINECTNGFWKIYINETSPTQQVYSFKASITGLDTNLLKGVTVFSFTNGAVNVATNPVFRWSGPSNFSTLVVDLLSGPAIFPPVGTTNWASAPTLNYGPDRFDVGYTSNNFSGITFTTPVEDTTSTPVQNWSVTANVSSTAFTYFTVGAPAPLPVQLVNVQPTNGAIRFSFQTLGGRPHTVQARTNLVTGTWVDLTNFTGDGSLQQFTFPATNPPIRFFRVRTQ